MVSFITSLYDSARYLDGYFNRIQKFITQLKKRGVDFEFIVIANEPNIKEEVLLKKIENIVGVTIYRVPRESLYASWNRGVNIARGEVIGFWNVDDQRSCKSVLKSLIYFDQGYDLVYFPFLIMWFLKIFNFYLPLKLKYIRPSKFDRQEFSQSMMCGPFFLFTKNFYNQVGPFDEQFKICADFDWCIRAAQKGGKFVLVGVCGGVFKVDGSGLSAGRNDRRVVENNVIYLRHNISSKIIKLDSYLNKEYVTDKIMVGDKFLEL